MKVAIILILVGILLIPTSFATWQSKFTTPIILEEDAKVSIALRPDIDTIALKQEDKPTPENLGIVRGWSFPIFNNDDEEIFFRMKVPRRWDGESNITFKVCCYIPETSQSGNIFNMSLDYFWLNCGDVITDSSYTTSYETICNSDLGNKTYYLPINIQYDIAGIGNEISDSDTMFMRLYRTAASSNEITGEVVIVDIVMDFTRDKLGGS